MAFFQDSIPLRPFGEENAPTMLESLMEIKHLVIIQEKIETIRKINKLLDVKEE